MDLYYIPGTILGNFELQMAGLYLCRQKLKHRGARQESRPCNWGPGVCKNEAEFQSLKGGARVGSAVCKVKSSELLNDCS